MLARGAVGGALVAGIAAAAHAAFEEDDALADLGEIGEDFLLVFRQDLRPDRHVDHQVVRACAGAVAAHAVAAALGLEVLRIAEVDQRVQALHGFEHDVAALAAVAAVGSAVFDILLAAEADGAGAARAALQIDLGLVEEMHGSAPSRFCR